MAIRSNSSDNFAPGAGPNGNTQGFQSAPGVGTGGMGIVDIVKYFGRTAVSPAIKEYLTTVDEGLKAAQLGIKEIRRVELSEPSGAQAYIATGEGGEKYAAIILFSDALSMTQVDYTPYSMFVIPALKSLGDLEGQVTLVSSYVLMNEDLTRASEMTGSLIMDLVPYVRKDLIEVNVQNLAQPGIEYIVDASVENAKMFENQVSPQSVRPRADIGFTVTMRLPQNRNMQIGNQQLMSDQRPFMAVGAYVDVIGPFIDPTTGASKYQPLIRVTFIESLMPIFGSIALALPLILEYFVRQGLWKRPFMKFAAGTPNLGQLTPDPVKADKLWFAPGITEMEAFLPMHTMPPMLCLDVVEGRHRISDLFMFQDPHYHPRIVDECMKFFNAPIPRFTGAVCKVANVDYIGAYGQRGGRMSDTRDVTYLDEVAKSGSLDEVTKKSLLNYMPRPQDRASVVSRLCNGFTSLYQCSTVLISAEFVSWIAACVPYSNIRIVDPNGYANSLPMASFDPSFVNYGAYHSVMSQQYRPFAGATGMYGGMHR